MITSPVGGTEPAYALDDAGISHEHSGEATLSNNSARRENAVRDDAGHLPVCLPVWRLLILQTRLALLIET